MRKPVSGHAIVIGGSIAGLLAAGVLAHHFSRVTVLERDSLPSDVKPRRGVPQGAHTHGLLARGLVALEGQLPGLGEELVARGARRADLGRDFRWFSHGGFHPRQESGFQGLLASRPLLEDAIRRRIAAHADIRLLQNVKVTGLIGNSAFVHGVRWRNLSLDGAEQEDFDLVMLADLVVDASGRGSRAPRWLEELGHQGPEEEVIEVMTGYTTRQYRREPHHLGGALGMVIANTPGQPRGGALVALEGDRWSLSAGGYRGDHAPTDPDGFLEFLRGLPTPEFFEVASTATPLTDPASFGYPSNRRRRYEWLSRIPRGFLATGDAFCSFNPIYGQGMTVAAMEAAVLAQALTERPDDPGPTFFGRAARIVDNPWSVVAGNDVRMPGVEAPNGLLNRCVNGWIDRVQRASHHDGTVSRTFLGVMNLMSDPDELFRPAFIWRVLRARGSSGSPSTALAGRAEPPVPHPQR